MPYINQIIILYILNSYSAYINYISIKLERKKYLGFPGSSDSKESTCSVGDLGSIPELERSPGGGNGNSSILSWRIPHGQKSLVG